MDERARLAVFISGGGRSMANLVHRSRSGELDADVVLVVASRSCDGVGLAESLGVTTLIETGELSAHRLEELVAEHKIDLVVLAGYLRRLPLPEGLRGRILNIHPAVLPGDGTPGRFGGKGMHGMRVHRAVIEAGE